MVSGGAVVAVPLVVAVVAATVVVALVFESSLLHATAPKSTASVPTSKPMRRIR